MRTLYELTQLPDRKEVIAQMKQEMALMLNHQTDTLVQVKKDLDHNADDPSTWFDLGMALMVAGELYESLSTEVAIMTYLEEHPEAEEVPEHLTDTADKGAQLYEDALRAFDKVRQMDPEYWGVQCQCGLALTELGKLEVAEKYFLQALKEDEEDVGAATYLANLYERMGNEELAQKYTQLAEELSAGGDF